MRTYDSPYVADWFAISLRWLSLVGLILSLSLGNRLDWTAAWPILLLLAWNVAMTFFAATNTRLNVHRQAGLGVDAALAAVFFFFQGGLAGPAAWVALLPILTGSVYFEFWGAFGISVLFALLQLASYWLSARSLNLASDWPVIIIAGVTVALGGVFGFLGGRLVAYLRFLREKRLQEEAGKLRIESERLRAIYDLTSAMTGTLSYRRVLDAALDMGHTALSAQNKPRSAPEEETVTLEDPNLVSAMLLFKGGVLRVGSARRFTNADIKVELPGAEGILKKVTDEGEPALASNIGYDPELSRVVALHSCSSAYCFPLRSGFNVYGVMLFAHSDPNYFNDDRVGMLDIIGRQAVVAIQNARLYQDLLEEKNRMVEVHEEARKKLARDLHDGPTQSVAAIAMRVNLARRMTERDPKAAIAELVKIEELAHRTTKEIRHMLFTLRPLILESQGLIAALQAMAEKMKETFGQNVVINVDQKLVEQLEMGKQGVIFYIVEEAVNNARKHAKAPVIGVRLVPLEAGIALLEIADNGVGFDLQSVNSSYDQRGSLGMINLRERTELVNGLLNIQSAPGKGTRVQVYIPLTEEAADRLHHKT